MDLVAHQELSDTIETLTHSGSPALDQKLMKKVKDTCRSSGIFVKTAYDTLMRHLNKDHSEVRLSTFQVINELFQRSHSFRQMVSANLHGILTQVTGMSPLPPPQAAANKLKQFSLTSIKSWVDKYGSGYPKLKLGYNHLKLNKKVNFEEVMATTTGEQRQRSERHLRQSAFYQQRLEKIKLEMREQYHDIKTCIKEIESCFQILMPVFTADESNIINTSSEARDRNMRQEEDESDSETEWEEVNESISDTSLAINGFTFNNSVNVIINVPNKVEVRKEDNETLIEIMKEHHRLLVKHYLPKINRWLEWFTKAGDEENLKAVIDLKGEANAAREKFNELQIINSDGEEEEEEQIEEDTQDMFMPNTRLIVPPWTTNTLHQMPSTSSYIPALEEIAIDPTTPQAQLKAKGLLNICSSSEPDNSAQSSLSIIPSVPYDVDLISWGSSDVSGSDIIGTGMDSLHRYWVQDKDVNISEEVQAQLKCRNITFTGQFEPVKWTCRAKLPNGMLCPRKDRYKCPLHGAIVPRDEHGEPIAVEDKSRSVDITTTGSSKEPTGGKKKRVVKKKHPGLTDIKANDKTARKRIEAKIFNKKILSRVGRRIDNANHKKLKTKFADNFNYSLRS